MSPSAGLTWGYNLFYDEISAGVSGDAATNAVTTNPILIEEISRDGIASGSLDGEEFAVGSGSGAINAAELVAGYNDRITASDYEANPITVTVTTQVDPDIGAWQYESSSSTGIIDGMKFDGIKFN
jgi:methylase of polypeptide subunit release factors